MEGKAPPLEGFEVYKKPEKPYHGYMAGKKNETRNRFIAMRAEGKATLQRVKSLSKGLLSDTDLLEILDAKKMAVQKYDILADCLDAIEREDKNVRDPCANEG